MWNSDRCWKIAAEVRIGIKALTYKKDKEDALKDNILIWWLGMGWVEEAERGQCSSVVSSDWKT